MPRHWPAILASALVLATVVVALIVGPGESPASRNAAILYQQALARADGLTDAERRAIDTWKVDQPFDAADVDPARWNAAVKHILEPVRRAATIAPCNWASAATDPMAPANEDAPRVRLVTKLAVWRAGIQFDQGNTRDAVDGLCDALVMNRRLAEVGSSVAQLVEVADQRMIYEQFAVRLPQLDDTSLAYLRSRLSTMPYVPMTHAAMRAEERKVFPWLTRAFAREPDSWVAQLNDASPTDVLAMLPGEAQGDAQTQVALLQAMARLAREAPRTFARYCEEAERLPAAFERALSQPTADDRDPIDAITEGIDSQNIVAQWLVLRLFDAYSSARRAELTAVAYEAIFMAGLDRVQHGARARELATDPFGDGPFAIRATSTGFELASQWRQAGQPVSLHFGPRDAGG